MRHAIPYALARVFMLPIVLLLIVTSAVPAQQSNTARPVAVDDAYWFNPQHSSLTLIHSHLLANDSGTQGTIVLLEQDAVHGTVTQQGNTFIYTPSDSFWSLKADSFAYKISGFGGESTATVRIFRWMPSEVEVEQGFEAAESINYTEEEEAGSSVDINSGSALLGSQGLQTTIGVGSSGFAVIEIPGTGDTTDNGGTVLLGGGLNQGGGNGGDHQDLDFEIVILTVGPQSDDLDLASVRVVLESVSGNRTLRVEMLDASVWPTVFVSSSTLSVTEDVNHIALEWWAQGAILDLNGQAVRVSGVNNTGLLFSHVRLGAMPLSGTPGGADFQYDGFEMRSYDNTVPVPLILGEGFEEGMGSWDYEIGLGMDTTSTAPTGQSALEGDLGVGDSFMGSQSPNDEQAINARLRIDVSQVLLSSTDWISFLQLGSLPNSNLHRDDVQLRLQAPAGQAQVGIAAFLSSAWTQPGWFPLTGEHVLEVQVQNSPTSLVDSGYVRLWIDGAPIATIYGIESFGRLTDWLRLGPQQVDPASSGVLIFDDVELWR